MFPLISMASYLETSPDWFAGFYDLSLCGSDGWRDDIDIPVYVYDGGYNGACTFNAPPEILATQQPVCLLPGSQYFYNYNDANNSTLSNIASVEVDKTSENSAASSIPTLYIIKYILLDYH